MTDLIIDADRFHDIPGLYAEINRIFMAAEDWKLGESLDALDDLMRGGYGALHGLTSARIVWTGFGKSRRDLGRDCTRQWLQAKLDRPDIFNERNIRARLEALDRGEGQTYFDMVVEILSGRPGIALLPE